MRKTCFATLLGTLVFVTTHDPAAPGVGTSIASEVGGAKDAGWLLGAWAFDREYTERAYEKSEDSKDGLSGLVVGQLVAGLTGVRMKVTDKEVIVTTKDGNGKAERYEVIDAPDAKTVTLKAPDGKVTAYHKEGDRLWIASTGTVRVPFYFKREK